MINALVLHDSVALLVEFQVLSSRVGGWNLTVDHLVKNFEKMNLQKRNLKSESNFKRIFHNVTKSRDILESFENIANLEKNTLLKILPKFFAPYC